MGLAGVMRSIRPNYLVYSLYSLSLSPIPCKYVHPYCLRTAEIEDVLTSSLVQVERNLSEQLNVVAQLRDQSSRYELPDASQRIDEIMVSLARD